jgi:hypothetical protein
MRRSVRAQRAGGSLRRQHAGVNIAKDDGPRVAKMRPRPAPTIPTRLHPDAFAKSFISLAAYLVLHALKGMDVPGKIVEDYGVKFTNPIVSEASRCACRLVAF